MNITNYNNTIEGNKMHVNAGVKGFKSFTKIKFLY